MRTRANSDGRISRRVFGNAAVLFMGCINRNFSLLVRTAKVFPRRDHGKTSRENELLDYGFGVEVVVVVEDSALIEVFDAGVDIVLTVVLVSFSFTVSLPPAGFTIVVLFSVFLSGGFGATVSVFCSQAPRSIALASMQMIFFIVVVCWPIMGQSLNRSKVSFRPCAKSDFATTRFAKPPSYRI